MTKRRRKIKNSKIKNQNPESGWYLIQEVNKKINVGPDNKEI
jgi:hypothetical protein